MIAGQQVAVQSARAIIARLEARVDPLTAAAFLKASGDDLRAVGFSRPKMAYGRILAEAIADGALDLDGLATLDDEAAIAALTSVKGIGRWTAEIYLLFALGRPAVLPAGALALCVAAEPLDRKTVVWGQGVYVRVDPG